MPLFSESYYMGLDPGEKGAIAIVDSSGDCVYLQKMPATARDLLYLMTCIDIPVSAALIERIDPRPTRYFSKQSKTWISTILRSTCVIYGDFLQLHMCALACGYDPGIVGPHDWQKGLGIPKKMKGEKNHNFKIRLRDHAKQLFPKRKVTLINADALLIAYFCMLRNQ